MNSNTSKYLYVITTIIFSTFYGINCYSQTASLSKDEAERYAAVAWKEAINRQTELHMQMWKNRCMKSGEYTMPFDVKIYGKKPINGRSLYISMHGGGNTTQENNNQQWENQKNLYKPSEGVYITPRAAVNDWNMWFRPHVDTLFAKIIQCAVGILDVDPNKVYLLGYSAGGDGVYRMAPRMADYWAASSMMAGHPGEASPLNLRNIGFMVWMGEHDNAYRRNTMAINYGEMMDSLQHDDPKGYPHKTTIVKGCGHWMNRQDTIAIEWLSGYTRTPRPKRIVWRQEESGLRDCFYNISIPRKEMQPKKEVRIDFEGNTINILRNDYNTLSIHLNDKIMNLSKPVTIKVNGKRIFKGKVTRKIENIKKSIAKRIDPEYIFCSEIKITDGQAIVM